jgi:hypothetical protein
MYLLLYQIVLDNRYCASPLVVKAKHKYKNKYKNIFFIKLFIDIISVQ